MHIIKIEIDLGYCSPIVVPISRQEIQDAKKDVFWLFFFVNKVFIIHVFFNKIFVMNSVGNIAFYVTTCIVPFMT